MLVSMATLRKGFRIRNLIIMLAIVILLFVLISAVKMIASVPFDDAAAINDMQETELISQQVTTDNQTELDQIETYDFSESYIYGDNEYCNIEDMNGNIQYKYKYKSAIIGGLYNTGTNALLTLLGENCFGSGLHRIMIDDNP